MYIHLVSRTDFVRRAAESFAKPLAILPRNSASCPSTAKPTPKQQPIDARPIMTKSLRVRVTMSFLIPNHVKIIYLAYEFIHFHLVSLTDFVHKAAKSYAKPRAILLRNSASSQLTVRPIPKPQPIDAHPIMTKTLRVRATMGLCEEVWIRRALKGEVLVVEVA